MPILDPWDLSSGEFSEYSLCSAEIAQLSTFPPPGDRNKEVPEVRLY